MIAHHYIRPARSDDIKRLSALIRNTLLVSNSADYDPRIILNLIRQYSTKGFGRMYSKWNLYLHEIDSSITGIIGLDGDTIRCFFVAPDRQGEGIGASLLRFVENEARYQGIKRLKVGASVTARSFYKKFGYRILSRQPDGEYGKVYLMIKSI